MTECFAGIDGGGTNSRMLVTDSHLNPLCGVYSGAVNLSAADERTVKQNLTSLFTQAESKLKGKTPRYLSVVMGTAGISRAGAEDFLYNLIIQLSGAETCLITGDLELPLYAYEPEAASNVFVLTAGTGSVCFGRNSRGETARAGGWGHLFGDEGGGYWLALRALNICMRAYDGREDATRLTPLLLKFFNCKTPPEIVSALYAKPCKSYIAGASVCVAEAASDGDSAALALSREAASELFKLLNAAARAVGPPDAVILAGGVLKHHAVINETLANEIKRAFPRVKIIQQDADGGAYTGVRGAVALAARRGRAAGIANQLNMKHNYFSFRA